MLASVHGGSRSVRWTRRLAWSTFALAVAWIALCEWTLMRPPRDLPAAPRHGVRRDHDGTLRFGPSYLRRRGSIWELGLDGDAVERGAAHATLLREPMVRVESRMMDLFTRYVPNAALRTVIAALVRVRHRGLDTNFPPEPLREIAAEARAFEPTDPFARFLPTYHRLVLLHALYDVSLGFEHSPMLGCSALVAAGSHTADGHTYVGRNFDMDVDDVFDREKTVVLHRPRGSIAFASVGWPGLTGVLTGMNAAGIFVAVHGARAGQPTTRGVPVPTTARLVLERARNLDDAIALVRGHAPMVSHMLVVVDGDRGEGVVLERVPGAPLGIRRLGALGGVANHYATPGFARDPRDRGVRDETSTLARQARLDERLAADAGRLDAAGVMDILRDRRGPRGATVPLGHRGALDAWIATHSVVADATARVIWVSEGPHTLGRYVRFDLRALLGDEFGASAGVQPTHALPADPALVDETWSRFRVARERLSRAQNAFDHRDDARALAIVDEVGRALPERLEDALILRARVLTRLGRHGEASAAWRAVLESRPPSPAIANEARRALGDSANPGRSISDGAAR